MSELWPALATPLNIAIRFEPDPTEHLVANLLDMIRHGVIADYGGAPGHAIITGTLPSQTISWQST
jgi:hypothetical protein